MLLSTGDWHVRNDRLKDTLSSIDQIIAHMRASPPDVVLFGGDLYHSNHPGPLAQRECTKRLVEMSKIAPVVGVSGNHDDSANASMTDSISIAAPRINISSRPKTVRVKDYFIVCIPFIRHRITQQKGSLLQTMEAVLGMALSKIPRQAKKVLVAHCTSLNAKYGGHTPVTLSRDLIWPSHLFEPFDFVSLGHIHKAQMLSEKVVYPGSIERVSFQERDEEKGFYTFTTWHKLETRPMFLVEGVPGEVEPEIRRLPNGAIVRVAVHLRTDETWYGMETSRFYSFDVRSVRPEPPRRYKDVNVDKFMEMPEMLTNFFQAEGKTEEEIEKLLDAFQKIRTDEIKEMTS